MNKQFYNVHIEFSEGDVASVETSKALEVDARNGLLSIKEYDEPICTVSLYNINSIRKVFIRALDSDENKKQWNEWKGEENEQTK